MDNLRDYLVLELPSCDWARAVAGRRGSRFPAHSSGNPVVTSRSTAAAGGVVSLLFFVRFFSRFFFTEFFFSYRVLLEFLAAFGWPTGFLCSTELVTEFLPSFQFSSSVDYRVLPTFGGFFLRPVPVYFWRLTSLVEFPRGPRFSSFFISFFLIGSHGMGGAYRSSASSPERFSGAAGRRRSPNAGRPDSTPVGCFFCFYQIVFKNC